MGKHSDLVIGSKQLGNSIAHNLKVEFTNKLESIRKMQKEELEYRSQGLSKLFNHRWTESERKEIESRIIKRINKIFNEPKNHDFKAKISQDVIEHKVKQELFQFFRVMD